MKNLYVHGIETMLRADLHTHSEASYDGGIAFDDYRAIVEDGQLGGRTIGIDVIGITDHDVIADETRELAREYPGRIIVGEEVTTIYKEQKVEIIGHELSEEIVRDMPTFEAVESILAQGGIVYIPHPYDSARKGASDELIRELYRRYDIHAIEVKNGRERPSLRNYGAFALNWAFATNALNEDKPVAMMAGSDAHGSAGIGYTYTTLKEYPQPDTDYPAHTDYHAIVDSADRSGHQRMVFAGYIEPFMNKRRKLKQARQAGRAAVETVLR